ncbi:MAG: hypothetical protein ACK46A_05715, partial [Akkermansiaceae bacterium]
LQNAHSSLAERRQLIQRGLQLVHSSLAERLQPIQPALLRECFCQVGRLLKMQEHLVAFSLRRAGQRLPQKINRLIF